MKKNYERNNGGLTLVESLVSIFLLSMITLSVVGAFFLSKSGNLRAKHRLAAVNIIKDGMERELRAGYDGGNEDEADYYATVTSADPVNVTIDDRGTSDPSDDLIGTIAPDPYYPDNIENADGSAINYAGVPYKIVGFVVTWTEDGSQQVCSERAVCYVSYHSST